MEDASSLVPGKDFIGAYEPDAYESVHHAFGHGGVELIELTDFMTHHRLTVQPSARGNLIVGPNGSGKSSIVCAIILGLGGSSNTMERASNLEGFIRRGCDKARIRITLHDTDCTTPTIITRTLERRQGASGVNSSYVIYQRGNGGERASAEDVTKLAQRFGIFVDNNCQVLPQESIANFVNSAPAALLKETERAILSGVLYEKHMNLEDLQNAAIKADATLGKLAKDRSKHSEVESNLTRQLQRSDQSKALADELDALKMCKPWLDVHSRAATLREVKKEKKKAAKLYAETVQMLPEAEEMASLIAAKQKSIFEQKRAAGTVPRAARQEVKDKLVVLEQSLKHIASAKMAVENMVNAGSGHEREMQKLDRKLRKTSRLLEGVLGAKEPKDLKADVAAAQARVAEKTTTATTVDRKAREVRQSYSAFANAVERAKNKVQQLRTEDANRINHVYRDIGSVKQRSLSQLEHFRRESDVQAEGPLAACVVPADELTCRVLNTLSFSAKLAYVCNTAMDTKRIGDECRQVGLEQAQTFAPKNLPAAAGGQRLMSDEQWEQAKALGATAQLMDNVECSPGMRAFLEVLGTHRMILAPHATDAEAVQILQVIPSGIRVATNSSVVAGQVGRLSGVVSKRFSKLGLSGMFKPGSASAELQDAMAALAAAKEQSAGHTKKMAEADAALQKALQQKQDAVAELQRVKDLLSKYEQYTAQYELTASSKQRLEELVHNKEANDRELQAKTTQFRSALCDGIRRYNALSKSLRSLPDGLKDEFCIDLEQLWTRGLNAMAKSRRDELRKQSETAEIEAERLTADADKLKAELKKLKAKAEQATDVSPSEPDTKGWQLVQDTLKGLGESHADRELQEAFQLRYTHVIDMLTQLTGDADLPKKLKDVRKRIEDLDSQIAAAYADSMGSNDAVRQKHDAWLQELRLAVANLSDQFAANCEQLGVKGTIELHEAGSVYKDYGLNLISSFHGAELSHAAAATQSGGEKSVTTILFLLAMQRSAPCPFRIIDEINQGMDETNERKVMHLIGSSSMPTADQWEALKLPADAPGNSHKRIRPTAAAVADPRGTLLAKAHHIGHQYFMLTPKLLPDLHFPDHVRIHTVFNGAAVTPQAYKTVTLSELVKRRRAAADMQSPQAPLLELATATECAEAKRQAQAQLVIKQRKANKRARKADEDEL